ncbi:MAG: nucleotidyltransferase domain-containing protein [Rubrobacteraceae bacterium]
MAPVRLTEPHRSTASHVAGELADAGAIAVVVVGSFARGEAGPDSDLDLLVIGAESYLPQLSLRDGLILSVSSQPFEIHRESFGQPELMCNAVSGWREALVLHDPEGLAARLIREANDWS